MLPSLCKHTRPSDIARALHADFSSDAGLARKQRLAIAHIECERRCEEAIDAKQSAGEDARRWLYSTEALTWLHGQLFSGLGERVATSLVSALLREGFLAADTPYGSLRFGVPRHALRFYFPALWPEAEQDEALLLVERRSGGGRAGNTGWPSPQPSPRGRGGKT